MDVNISLLIFNALRPLSVTRISFFSFFFFFSFLGLDMWQLEVPRLEVESELQLSACTTVIAMQDPSCVCNLHHSSQKHQILNPQSESRDWTYILMNTSWVCYCWATTGTPSSLFFSFFYLKKKYFLKLKYTWFTVLCQFLLYSKGIQSYICVYVYDHSFSHITPPCSIPRDWTLFPVLYSRT